MVDESTAGSPPALEQLVAQLRAELNAEPAVAELSLPYHGQWSPPGSSGALFVHNKRVQASLLALASSSAAAEHDGSTFLVHPDSGCTGSMTPYLNRLINCRPCRESFASATGARCNAIAIGDMPVLVRDRRGRLCRLVIRNVRCVPGFRYTLLSVRQMWNEQSISTLFDDINELRLPQASGGQRFPFDSSRALPTVHMVSAARRDGSALPAVAAPEPAPVAAAAEPAAPPAASAAWASLGASSTQAAVPSAAPVATAGQPSEPSPSSGRSTASLGFHHVRSTAHVAKLPAARAAELMHRRCHFGVNKLRALANTTSDAPKVLASASGVTCVHCAEAGIKKTPHPGTLSAPAPGPGTLHCDLKELTLSFGGYRYAFFAIDEFTRYVFLVLLKRKSEAADAVKRVSAAFDATVGHAVDENGHALPRPRVMWIHSDREGKLMSAVFAQLAADKSWHHTVSPSHDHDLNPIAERIIGLIAERSIATRLAANADARLWPWTVAYVVAWHNASVTSLGSSTADSSISPYQRFTLKPPPVMDLATFGCRAVINKPPPHKDKTGLAANGYVGAFLGRSRSSKGSYDVLVGNVVRCSSSVLVDEEYFPLRPASERHQPLTSLSHAASQPPLPPLTPSATRDERQLRFLNIFSGPYARSNGLAAKLQQRGWASVEQIDNDAEKGGGWAHDLLCDSTYAALLARATAGEFDAFLIAFPCSTFSITRFFDATANGKDRGPPVVRTFNSPDGLPDGEIDPLHATELRLSNQLLDRVVRLAIAARRSAARTTIVVENPADRSSRGGIAASQEFENHGSLFATSLFQRLQSEISLTDHCTFAYCMLEPSGPQKYTTLYFSAEAAPVLNALSAPEFQCSHPRGSHSKKAGGRGADGAFVSGATAAYPDKLNSILADAFTYARTGRTAVAQSLRPPPPLAPLTPAAPPAPAEAWQGAPSPPVDGPSPPPAAPPSAAAGRVPPSAVAGGVPPTSPAPEPPTSAEHRPPRASPFLFPNLQGATPSRPGPLVPPPPPSGVLRPPAANLRRMNIENSFESGTLHSQPAAASRRPNTVRFAPGVARPGAAPPLSPPGPQTPDDGTDPETYASYEPFSAAAVMEAAVAECAADAAVAGSNVGGGYGELLPLTAWQELRADELPRRAGRRLPGGSRAVEVCVALRDDDGAPSLALLAQDVGAALRADSADAPSTYAEAARRGIVWVGPDDSATGKELKNHRDNSSWQTISVDELPRGRRVHRMLWVFKVKRDGTAKARLCVQGSSLEEGVDYQQTFSAALRHSSARALFAYAARHGCGVRSVDLVAAYLQGDFLDGEVVYTHLPQGAQQLDARGRPMLAKVIKPIYGIQQAGRRLQRKLFAWLREYGFEPLDDSDSCIFKLKTPDGELLTIGVYVDNLQIVHSAKLDDAGRGPAGCAYNAFMDALVDEWKVTDEGPMDDLLGMEIDYNADGSVTLHQRKYVEKVVQRFLPDGPSSNVQRNSLPYSPLFLVRINEALSQESCDHPELVRALQERLGCLMYAATSTRPDIAYPVHQLCKCMHKPTPELLEEADHVLSYLARNASVGLTYARDPTRLAGFADASWETRHSTSGWTVLWQSAALVWDSRKQQSIALSSCEAEIIALSEAAKDVVYLRKLVKGLGAAEPDASRLSTDSQSARDVSYNPEHHGRVKHVERRHFYVRDMVEKFELEVPFVRTNDNLADFFTKPFKDAKKFYAMRRMIMNEPSA